jgi:AraC-like DNA-binding protein
LRKRHASICGDPRSAFHYTIPTRIKLIDVRTDPPTDPSLPRYAERPPGPALAPWIECYWTIRATDAPSVPNRVLPDGCSDIILGLGDVSGPVAIGPMRTAEVFPLTGVVDFFGIRFHPGCALPFLGLPLSEITDARVPLDTLWGDDTRLLADVAPEVRVAHAEQLLTERLRRWMRGRRADEPLASRAIALLRQARGGASIAAVASALGVGERRLERAFDRSVGLSPKVFGRVLRLRRAIRQIRSVTSGGAAPSWTAVAFNAGYADQPHLIREFRALAGVTPAQYAAEPRGVGFVQDDDAESA